MNDRHWCVIFAVTLDFVWLNGNKWIFDILMMQPSEMANKILGKVDAISASLQY